MTTSTTASQGRAEGRPCAACMGCSAFVSPASLSADSRFRNSRSLNLHMSFVDGLLRPLNVCPKGTWYLPWECEHEHHERCETLNGSNPRSSYGQGRDPLDLAPVDPNAALAFLPDGRRLTNGTIRELAGMPDQVISRLPIDYLRIQQELY